MKTPRLVLATLTLSFSLIAACSTSEMPSSSGTGGGTAPGGSGGKATGGSAGSTSAKGGSGGGGVTSTAGTTSQADAAATGGAAGGAGGSGPGLDGPSSSEAGSGIDGGGKLQYPLLKVLPLFTAADVPAKGPKESADINPKWTVPATLPTGLPGKGIAQHPFIYFGESYRRILVVIDGKVAWHYDTEDSWEVDDIWMLSNGNVLFAHMGYIEEVTPKKEQVFRINAQGEIHTCQPIGLDKVLFVQSQAPKAHVKLYNKTTKVFEIDQEIDSGPAVHVQCRRFRMTGRGTYIAAYLGAGRVAELDKDFKELWSYKVASPWSAAPLKNGNVMIQSEGTRTALEVNNKGEVIWQVTQAEILPTGMKMGNTQTCERLSTGNTVMFGNGGMTPGNVQAIEVTTAKEVVWVLQDWQHLGDATSAQFLDEPGYPEVPGDTNH